MFRNPRRAVFVLLALIVGVSGVCLDQGRAQVKVMKGIGVKTATPAVPQPPAEAKGDANPDGFLNSGISLPKDEKRRNKAIQAAVDYIEKGDWTIAIPHVQKLLEIDEDVFVRLTRKNADGKEVPTWVSVKREADRLIGTLPPTGLDFYKVSFGAKAAEMLKKAKQSGDPALLAEIMKKYAHTDAGGEAIKILADYHLDRGNYIAAILCYDKLFNREGADKLPPVVLFKAAYAAHMAPASATSGEGTQLAASKINEKELWKQLRNQTRDVQLGPDESRSVADLEEYVSKLERANFVQNATDAIVFRATPDRSNQLVGGPAFMSATWRHSMMFDEDNQAAAHKRLNDAKDQLKRTHQPIIPAFAPITVTVSKGEERIPLLIYKNYWGIVARNLKKKGEIAWMSPSSWSLEKMLDPKGESGKTQPMNQWLDFYVSQNMQPQIVFENSTVGTLSTDGKFAYLVEDLAVPPPPQMMNMNMGWQGNMNNPNFRPEVQDAINHSRLQAFELKSGKLVWELGDPEVKGLFADCYFLGPPLPLGGKLYLLIEKQQELRLVCLEILEETKEGGPKYTPKIVATQTLGTTQEKMQNDVLRRITAAHLTYGEGILVCPTNAGAVFGINLLENSLVWAYPYREKSDQPQQAQMGQQFIGRGGRVFIAGGGMAPGISNGVNPNHNQWKASAPVIADGKVVFTAPDARSIHCVNLRDGSPVWHKPKHEDDLYLGNVCNGKVLIVGKKNVRGLSLSSGETLWVLETGMPAGQGIGSDNFYYLPLKEAGRTKKPQICAIDVDRGKIVPGVEPRPRSIRGDDYDVPGNLLFYEGDVISLTDEEVVVYPQLKVKLAQMDELIAKNPNDPVGLTERGDLRLSRNDLPGAIEDLSTALKNNPDKETRDRARGKLFDTLTAYISDHFNDAEKYLQEYEELCKVDMEGADPKKLEELQAEQRRRRATFLWLVGKGREEQGRLVEAFEKYQQFGAEAGKQSDLVPAVDEPQVKAAPDVWSRGRIIAMIAKAKPEHRAPLEKLIADKWEKLRDTNDLNELRQFVRMFGAASTAGQEARLQLAERLMEQKESAEEHPLLEAELELNQFRTGEHSPEMAARATEALARLYTRKGLLEDAAYCYRKLGRDFAKVQIRDGKTGQDFYNDTATDKRLLPYLDEPDPFGSIKFKAKAERDGRTFHMPDRGQLFQFEHSGERLPFFRNHIVGLNFTTHEFKLLDRNESDGDAPYREVWHHKLTPTMLQMLTQQVFGYQVNQFNQVNRFNFVNNNEGQAARFPYRTMGHLIVLPACDMLFGIDPVNRRVLWEKKLAPDKGGPIQPNAPFQNHIPSVDPRDGSVVVTYPGTNWAQRLGQAGPLEGQAVYVQVHDTLTALDPLNGRTLWSRMDVNPRNYVFADDRHVFVVEMDGDNNKPKAHATRVFRAADGISVRAPDFAAIFEKRLQLVGRHILVSEPGPGNTVLVRLYDPLTGADAWKQTYPARSLVARSEESGFTGIVEPDGKVHVIDLKARKEVMTGQMAEPAKDLLNVQVIHLLADRKFFYFACQAPMDGNNANRGGIGVMSNVTTNLGMRTLPVNGMIYAFHRSSGPWGEKGAWEWYLEAKNQMLVLDQFRDLPVVFLTARRQAVQNIGGFNQRGVRYPVSVMSIQKWNGAVVFGSAEDDNLQNATNFYGIRADERAGTIDFLSPNMKITHFPDPKKNKGAAPAADTPARRDSQATSKQSAPADAKLKRSTIERLRIREIGNPLTPP
jgi:outer membrane protein assembly factor BamB/tetratricopeptide (TPR) repeat protein